MKQQIFSLYKIVKRKAAGSQRNIRWWVLAFISRFHIKRTDTDMGRHARKGFERYAYTIYSRRKNKK